MKKSYRFAGYFIYAVLMGFLLNYLIRYDQFLLQLSKETFNRYPHLIYITVYPIFIGFLFALPNFVKTLTAQGKWRFDWVKATAIGIPAFFGSTFILFYFSPLGIFLPPTSFLAFGTDFSTISGIVFGYTVLNAFHKASLVKQQDQY